MTNDPSGLPVGETPLEELEQESDGLPLRERYGLVLALILVAYLIAGFDQTRLIALVNSVIWVLVLLAALWSPGLPRALRRVGLGATFSFTVPDPAGAAQAANQ